MSKKQQRVPGTKQSRECNRPGCRRSVTSDKYALRPDRQGMHPDHPGQKLTDLWFCSKKCSKQVIATLCELHPGMADSIRSEVLRCDRHACQHMVALREIRLLDGYECLGLDFELVAAEERHWVLLCSEECRDAYQAFCLDHYQEEVDLAGRDDVDLEGFILSMARKARGQFTWTRELALLDAIEVLGGGRMEPADLVEQMRR